MHTTQKRRPEVARESRSLSKRMAAVMVEAALVVLVGCASPGPPLPPSLKLPQIATDLSASRVGDRVILHWTTPARTTDKLLITGNVTAAICRDVSAGDTVLPSTPAKPAMRSQTRRRPAARSSVSTAIPCTALRRVNAAPGASEFIDTLPESLTSGSHAMLSYRIELMNPAGRTAGPSAPVFVASGPPPRPIQDLHATATKGGVVLEWSGNAGSSASVELERIAENVPVAASPATKGGLPAAPREQPESRFRAGGPNGTVDRTALLGRTYRYSAQRVQTVDLGGRTLEVRSLPSAEVTVAMNDVFPPEPPVALVAVPGFAGEADAQRPTIDLSWDPNLEPRIAEYRVYRRDLDGDAPDQWKRLGTDLVRVASYRDLAVIAGKRYAYRVTAVDDAGHESAPSGDVMETAPAP